MSEWDVVVRIAAALVAGGLVGLERTYHGRAAGLRTYALVSFGSALAVATAHYDLFSEFHGAGDATRVIQGIVTGIGFLGAGVIVKDGFTVRGLTTAASIWVVSAVGVAIGAGLYLSGAAAVVLTLIALAALRRLEDRLPAQSFIHCTISFRSDQALDEDWLRDLVARLGFGITELSYRLDSKTGLFEYRTVMWTSNPRGPHDLRTSLDATPEVVAYRIAPSRD